MNAEFSAAASAAGSGDEFRLSRDPTLPLRAAKPARAAIAIIGLILGTVLALIAGLGAEAVDQSVRGSRDVLNLLDMTPMAIVPEIRNSIFVKRRSKHLKVLAASLVVGVPVFWLIVHLAVG
jgi:ABC-type dipeptide/oligopeptide/nickel transport system permease subunit